MWFQTTEYFCFYYSHKCYSNDFILTLVLVVHFSTLSSLHGWNGRNDWIMENGYANQSPVTTFKYNRITYGYNKIYVYKLNVCTCWCWCGCGRCLWMDCNILQNTLLHHQTIYSFPFTLCDSVSRCQSVWVYVCVWYRIICYTAFLHGIIQFSAWTSQLGITISPPIDHGSPFFQRHIYTLKVNVCVDMNTTYSRYISPTIPMNRGQKNVDMLTFDVNCFLFIRIKIMKMQIEITVAAPFCNSTPEQFHFIWFPDIASDLHVAKHI